jgi:hypothetical protein
MSDQMAFEALQLSDAIPLEAASTNEVVVSGTTIAEAVTPTTPLDTDKHMVTAVGGMVDSMVGGYPVAVKGTGKGGLPAAKVLTPRGWITLETIRVGQEIVDPEGGTTTVTGVFRRGVKEIFQVTFTDRSSAFCSGGQLWLVNTPLRKSKGKPGIVKTLDEIAAKGLSHANGNLQHFIPLIAPVRHPEVYLPIDPYLLGLLLGDGGLTGGTPTMTTADDEILASVAALLPDGVTAKRKTGSDIEYYLSKERRSCKPNPLTVALSHLGLMGLGSATKFIPDIYMLSSVEQRTGVLQGLFDTDGSLHLPNGVGIDYSSTSERLTDNVRSLVQSLGGTTSRVVKKKTSCPYKGEIVIGETYRIYIALPSDIRPFRLSRKLANVRIRTKYDPTRAVSEIKSIGKSECICISVGSENRLYVTDGYIVTAAMNAVIAVREKPVVTEPKPQRKRAHGAKTVKGVIKETLKKEESNMRLHQPALEPAPKKVFGAYEDIVFDDELLAKMMANMAFHGMTLENLAG